MRASAAQPGRPQVPPSRAVRATAVALATLSSLVAGGRLQAQLPDSVAHGAAEWRPAVVVVGERGPRASGRLLQAALSAPHATIGPGPQPASLRRDTTYASSVVVIGRSATVGSTVHGDVVVVGGDLFLHPGATVDGRAIAIGGGVYNSALATVRGGLLSFRDETFAARERDGPRAGAPASPDTLTLDYRAIGASPPGAITFPAYGFHLPAYDRVNGVSLAFGPTITLMGGSLELVPTVTYRSHLGEADPGVRARIGVGRATDVALLAGRTTRTNEAWNRSDFLNGSSALIAGIDARNYYRAELAEARLSRRWQGPALDFAPYVGALSERAWSIGPDSGASSAPWSLFLRRDRLRGMLRPNPRVASGRISSGLAGADVSWTLQDVVASLGARVEVPFEAVDDARFIQTTLDGAVGFPTFGTQRLDIYGHAVFTNGDAVPPQRYAYLGGADGTIVTLDLLEMGGDQLMYFQGLYSVPLERLKISFVGSPVVALRYAVGAAGIDRLPDLEQNVGIRVTLNLLRLQVMMDPASRETRTAVALSLFR